jgi:hypothetical protein
MKEFTVVYLPYGREDKEWMNVSAKSEKDLIKNFKPGVILDIK